MECLASGWGEVVRAFGHVPRNQNDGVLTIVLSPPYDRPDHRARARCDTAWLTNRSMLLGWAEYILVNVGRFARVAFLNVPGADGRPPHRSSWAEVTARIGWFEWRDPSGTGLARRDIGNFREAAPAGAYGAARYWPPADFSLREKDASGVDEQAVFGFFNRANAAYFCRNAKAQLADLRGAGKGRRREEGTGGVRLSRGSACGPARIRRIRAGRKSSAEEAVARCVLSARWLATPTGSRSAVTTRISPTTYIRATRRAAIR